MVLSDLLDRLRQEGFGRIPPGRVHYAVRQGYVDRPRLNGSLSFEYGDEHVEQMRAYLRNPPKRGPKPTQVES